MRATDLKPLDELPEARRTVSRAWTFPSRSRSPEVFEGCDLIVLSPGRARPTCRRSKRPARRGVRVIGEVELAAPFLKGQTIGITGSNGKTTTTSLIGHILREAGVPVQVGGNIGTPVTAMVETSRADGWNVLELSSFQLETIAEFRAHIGAGAECHPESSGPAPHLRELCRRQGPLFETMRADDFAVLNADDPVCVAYAGRTAARRAVVQQPAQSDARRQPVQRQADARRQAADGGRARFPFAAATTSRTCWPRRLPRRAPAWRREQIAAAVRTFQAVEHRLEFVRKVSGIDFYNDSKATSVDATLKAVDAFPGGLWVILGGKDKGLDYSLLREPLAAKAHAALLIGAAAEKIAGAVRGRGAAGGCRDAGRGHRVRLTRTAQPGDTVLLAPACASFDQFRSYEHRGEVFKQTREPIAGRRIDMAQRLKTDWILFGTVLVMVSFGAADPLQRVVDHRQDGPALPARAGIS